MDVNLKLSRTYLDLDSKAQWPLVPLNRARQAPCIRVWRTSLFLTQNLLVWIQSIPYPWKISAKASIFQAGVLMKFGATSLFWLTGTSKAMEVYNHSPCRKEIFTEEMLSPSTVLRTKIPRKWEPILPEFVVASINLSQIGKEGLVLVKNQNFKNPQNNAENV